MAARVTAFVVFVIVAATVIAGLIVGAQRETLDGPVDLIVVNGKVFTGDADDTIAEAVAIRGNRILKVGSDREIRQLRRRQTLVLDAREGSVLPGFNDGLVRLIDGALSLQQVDLRNVASAEEAEVRIQAFAESNPNRRWIVGHGWSTRTLPEQFLTKETLDRLVPDRPVYLVADTGRASWVNSKGLEAAGITARTRSPKGGTIVRDPRTREPLGLLRDQAMTLVSDLLPAVTREERLQAVRDTIALAHRYGVTSMQDAGGSAEALDIYEEIRRGGDLHVRIYAALAASALDQEEAATFDALRRKYPDDPLLKTGAIALSFATPDTGSAARPTGLTAGDLTRAVARLDRDEWQIFVHARGNQVGAVLGAFDAAARTNPAPARGRRHRVDTFTTLDPESAGLLETIGAVALPLPPNTRVPSTMSVPGVATTSAASNAGAGPAASVFRTVADAGGRLILGSNWPESLWFDPHVVLQTVLESSESPATEVENRPEGPGGLSMPQALAAYTREAAWASFDEERKGTLAPGMLADIVILNSDIVTTPPDRLSRAPVTTTIFDGKIVYSRSTETDD